MLLALQVFRSGSEGDEPWTGPKGVCQSQAVGMETAFCCFISRNALLTDLWRKIGGKSSFKPHFPNQFELEGNASVDNASRLFLLRLLAAQGLVGRLPVVCSDNSHRRRT